MERMISNHKIQTALDEIKEISKIDLALYSEKGKQVAATFELEGDMEDAEGEHRKSGSPSCFHGDLFKHGNATGTEPQTDLRRLCEEHPRSPCLQGNLAGGRGLYLYGGDTGTGSGRTWHQKDSTGTGGGCYHPWKLSEVEAVCGRFYHRIPSGKMRCHTGRGNAGGAA